MLSAMVGAGQMVAGTMYGITESTLRVSGLMATGLDQISTGHISHRLSGIRIV